MKFLATKGKKNIWKHSEQSPLLKSCQLLRETMFPGTEIKQTFLLLFLKNGTLNCEFAELHDNGECRSATAFKAAVTAKIKAQ